MPASSPELRLLLLACDVDVTRALERARPLLCGALDGERLLALAAHHGLSGLLHRLLRSEPGALPQALRERLAARARELAARALLLRDQARQTVALLERAGVAALVLKGPALAARWPEPALREAGDLDLLVRRADAGRAWDALLRAGWGELLPVGPRLRRAALRSEREQPFVGAGPFPLDLHWGLFDPHVWPVADEDEVWGAAVPLPVGEGPPLRTLGPAHTLSLLVLHGAKHLWSRLGWLVDLQALAPSAAAWEAAAAAPDAARAVGLALRLGREALGLSGPPGAAAPGEHPALVPVLRAVRAGWESPRDLPPLLSLRLQLRLREGPRARLRLTLGELLVPTAEERALLPLPPGLDPLLAGLRLVRLLGRHVR